MRLKFIALAATVFLLAGCASPEAEPATTSATTQTSQQEQATDEASADPQQMDAAESMDYETPEETQQADSSETDSAGESEQEDKEQDSSPKEPEAEETEAEETEAEEPEALETEEPAAEPVEPETPAAEPAGFTMAMISENNTASRCWVAIEGMAYDLTDWITSHPGGQGAITGLCGKDGTAMFLSRHGGQANPDRTLDMYVLGPITG